MVDRLPTVDEIAELVSAGALADLVDVYARLAKSNKYWLTTESAYFTVLDELSIDDMDEFVPMLSYDRMRRYDYLVRHRLDTFATLLKEWRFGKKDLDSYEPFFKWVALQWEFYQTARLQLAMERFRAAGRPVPAEVIATARRIATVDRGSGQFSLFVKGWDDPTLNPGEPWADLAMKDLTGLGPEWRELTAHCRTATSGKPSTKWEEKARELVARTGDDTRRRLLTWLEAVPQSHGGDAAIEYARHTEGVLDPFNANAARGLIWTVAFLGDHPDAARILGRLAEVMLKKIPGVGPRAPKVANAAVYALARMEGEHSLGQLARLSSSVKFKGTLNQINDALRAKAEALGVTRDEIEEMAVPAYGLTEVGRQVVEVGDCRAEISVTADAKLIWFNSAGKQTKSPPAAVKRDHADQVKELKAAVKDINKMLSAQAERLDRQFLLQREWAGTVWRQRYDTHPLMGTLARRLLWRVDGQVCGYADGGWRDLSDKPVPIDDSSRIRLWHPIGEEVATVVAWREWLERHEVVQPFKQAHREVYLLTAAEENTRLYSNRFAAHIIRQHQFHALAAARGWLNRLRLMVDDAYRPPYKDLPNWGLRAEFWVEGIGEDYGVDTTDSGSYLRLVTDQVRFYRIDAAANYAHAGGGGYGTVGADIPDPVPVAEVPPLVLSEVLRDVDLFVGVASIGNDPTWSDGGPQGRFLDYWNAYSFGELTQTAQTRKELLSRLVPRLAIRDRAHVEDRFLVVRGDIRTYKIHLGSGNILMAPNDQYLCIVPGQYRTGSGEGFLPFEGDGVLAVILSKAIMLANDTKITDRTITSQLGR